MHPEVPLRFWSPPFRRAEFPSQVYTQQYCQRGEMENRFKEQQLELFSDHTSTHTNGCNQLGCGSLHGHVLMNDLRQDCLATELARAQVNYPHHLSWWHGAYRCRLVSSYPLLWASLSDKVFATATAKNCRPCPILLGSTAALQLTCFFFHSGLPVMTVALPCG